MIRILIFGRDLPLRVGAAKYLNKHIDNCQCFTANGLLMSMEVLSINKINVIVFDLDFDNTGYALTQIMQRYGEKIPVVLLSGVNLTDDERQGLIDQASKLGSVSCIGKLQIQPMRELQTAVQTTLAGMPK